MWSNKYLQMAGMLNLGIALGGQMGPSLAIGAAVLSIVGAALVYTFASN